MGRELLQPSSILTGLMALDRPALATFLALFEDSKLIGLVSDKVKAIGHRIEEWIGQPNAVINNESLTRIEAASQAIENSDLSNDVLRFILWAHLRAAVDLDPALPTTIRDLDIGAKDISIEIRRDATTTMEAAKRITERASATFLESIKKLFKELKIFSENPANLETFDTAVRNVIFQLFSNIIENDEVSDEEKSELLSLLREELQKVDKRILSDHQIKDLTDQTLRGLLTTSSGLVALMGVVKAAGFSAYIFAAKASAILPFVGGKTLVTLLYILSNPLFVFPAIIAGGYLAKNKLDSSIKRKFAVTIGSLLAIRGMEAKTEDREKTARFFFQSYDLIQQNHAAMGRMKIPDAKEYESLASKLCRGLTQPVQLSLSSGALACLNSKIILTDRQEGCIEGFLFPKDTSKLETAVLSGIVLGDFLFDYSAIEPEVLEAADFCYNADLANPFEFAQFTEKISALAPSSISGHEDRLLGYTAEQIVAARLINDGYDVTMPESANQPGFDLIVNGHNMQVKCFKAEYTEETLQKHFDNYPEIPVIVSSEMFGHLGKLDDLPAWAGKVFSVEGYSHEVTEQLVDKTFNAGVELGDYEFLPSIAAISLARNAHGWWKEEISLGHATFSTVVDTAARGSLAIAGGFAGKAAGALIFGPAGAYIFGGVAGIAASTQASKLKEFSNRIINKKLDDEFDRAARDLLEACKKELKAKIQRLQDIIDSLPKYWCHFYIANRWGWEIAFCESRIREAEYIAEKRWISGERRAILAAQLSTRCGIHAYCLQDEYEKLLKLFNQNNWATKMGGWIGDIPKFWNSNQKRANST